MKKISTTLCFLLVILLLCGCGGVETKKGSITNINDKNGIVMEHDGKAFYYDQDYKQMVVKDDGEKRGVNTLDVDIEKLYLKGDNLIYLRRTGNGYSYTDLTSGYYSSGIKSIGCITTEGESCENLFENINSSDLDSNVLLNNSGKLVKALSSGLGYNENDAYIYTSIRNYVIYDKFMFIDMVPKLESNKYKVTNDLQSELFYGSIFCYNLETKDMIKIQDYEVTKKWDKGIGWFTCRIDLIGGKDDFFYYSINENIYKVDLKDITNNVNAFSMDKDSFIQNPVILNNYLIFASGLETYALNLSDISLKQIANKDIDDAFYYDDYIYLLFDDGLYKVENDSFNLLEKIDDKPSNQTCKLYEMEGDIYCGSPNYPFHLMDLNK